LSGEQLSAALCGKLSVNVLLSQVGLSAPPRFRIHSRHEIRKRAAIDSAEFGQLSDIDAALALLAFRNKRLRLTE
jgi:hypothetical protein